MPKLQVKAIWLPFVILILTLFCLIANAGAQTTVVLNPVKDTYVNGYWNVLGNPGWYDTNHGSEQYLYVGEYVRYTRGGVVESTYNTLVAFDLSGIPSGANIVSAELKLYYIGNGNPGDVYQVCRITKDWDENTVTGQDINQNKNVVCTGITATVPSTPNTWMTWDVTDEVKAFLDGTYENHGWLIKSNTYNSWNPWKSQYLSKDSSDSAYYPQLVITYTTPSTPSTAIPEFTMLGFCLAIVGTIALLAVRIKK